MSTSLLGKILYNSFKSIELCAKNKVYTDTRPIKRVLRKYSNLKYQDLASLEAFKLELDNFTTLIEKHHLVLKWSKVQESQYEQEVFVKEQEIEKANQEILRLKQVLNEAQRIKSQKIEYDAIAKQIKKYSPRDKSIKAREKLHNDIKKLKTQIEFIFNAKLTRQEKIKELSLKLHLIQDEMNLDCMELDQEQQSDVDEEEISKEEEEEEGEEVFKSASTS